MCCWAHLVPSQARGPAADVWAPAWESAECAAGPTWWRSGGAALASGVGGGRRRRRGRAGTVGWGGPAARRLLAVLAVVGGAGGDGRGRSVGAVRRRRVEGVCRLAIASTRRSWRQDDGRDVVSPRVEGVCRLAIASTRRSWRQDDGRDVVSPRVEGVAVATNTKDVILAWCSLSTVVRRVCDGARAVATNTKDVILAWCSLSTVVRRVCDGARAVATNHTSGYTSVVDVIGSRSTYQSSLPLNVAVHTHPDTPASSTSSEVDRHISRACL